MASKLLWEAGEMGDNGEKHKGMGQRGVTRPMEEMKGEEGKGASGGGDDSGHEQHGEKESHHQHHHHEMSDEDRRHMLRSHHKQTLWVYWTLILLGFWTVLSPFTFGYGNALVDPSGGRAVWLSLEGRVAAMTWSDLLSGLGLIVFGWRGLLPNRPVSLWICCLIGVWLNMAPILFWAPSAAAYLNGTLVGAWVIALAILIPGMPNMILYMQMGGDQPPGWSYNPSSWPQRWIMIVTGFMGWVVSRYLAAFQLGYIEHAWDPFFGEGSRQVLNSDMSHMWPISDGALGAFAYTFEFLMGYMGATSRWRTMPWMVTFFGILVIPLGLVHIFLVISQPVVVGHWCTFCLLAAAIMLPMIPLEVDEVIAMGQHLRRAKQRGESVWKVFWKGGSPEGSTMDERSPELIELPNQPLTVLKAAFWGMSFPWTLAVATGLGIWLMFAPAALGATGMAANIAHLGGALIVVASVIAVGEPLRLIRYLNFLLAAVVVVGLWVVSGGNLVSQINATVTGILVAVLSIPRGPKKEKYGGWDRFVR